MIVVPKKGAFDEDTAGAAAGARAARRQTRRKDMGATEVVGGPAVLLDDFDQATSARFPLLVIVLVLVTFLVLLLLFRAPVLALVRGAAEPRHGRAPRSAC